MVTIRKYDQPGHAAHGWLHTYHSVPLTGTAGSPHAQVLLFDLS